MTAIEPEFPDHDEQADQAPRRGARRAVAMLAILALFGAGGWLAYKNRDALTEAGRALLNSPPATSGSTAATVTAAQARDLDDRVQMKLVWNVVRKEFPDWYGERLKETAKLSAEKQPEEAIVKHIVESLVALRRQNADKALAASTATLRGIASAFLENLKSLSEQGPTVCYGFISQGETSPPVVELMRSSGKNRYIEAQTTAIFEAIAEGRRSPSAHERPSKADYDLLADQLTQLGWSQADLQLFADPRALARATPERVCKMVQDWFTAHIVIQDQQTQERLLVETLRPVVAG